MKFPGDSTWRKTRYGLNNQGKFTAVILQRNIEKYSSKPSSSVNIDRHRHRNEKNKAAHSFKCVGVCFQSDRYTLYVLKSFNSLKNNIILQNYPGIFSLLAVQQDQSERVIP